MDHLMKMSSICNALIIGHCFATKHASATVECSNDFSKREIKGESCVSPHEFSSTPAQAVYVGFQTSWFLRHIQVVINDVFKVRNQRPFKVVCAKIGGSGGHAILYIDSYL
jgi:hypothetical protein